MARVKIDGQTKTLIDKRYIHAAELISTGMKVVDAAKEIGVSEPTVRRWMKSAAFLEAYNDILKSAAMSAYMKAFNLLEKQMGGSKNEWIQQNAAREIMARTHDDVLGKENSDIRIVFENAPDIGMPDKS